MKKIIIIALIVITLVCVFYYLQTNGFLNIDQLMLKIESFRSYGVLSIFAILGLYFVTGFIFLPIAYISVFSGMLYGIVPGGIIAYIGSMINQVVSFLFARYLLRKYIIKLKEKIPKFDDIFQKIENRGKSFVFYARIIFLTPYNSLNLISGVSDISFKDYFVASAAGSVIQAFFYSYTGYSLDYVSNKQMVVKESIKLVAVIIIFFVLIELARRLLFKPKKSS